MLRGFIAQVSGELRQPLRQFVHVFIGLQRSFQSSLENSRIGWGRHRLAAVLNVPCSFRSYATFCRDLRTSGLGRFGYA